MTSQEAYIGLNLVKNIGPRRCKKLIEVFETAQNVLGASAAELRRVEGISLETAQAIRAVTAAQIARQIERARKLGLTIITCEDADYPQALRDIYDPPLALFVKGDPECFHLPAFAVVGSRRASFYGQKQARRFAGALAEAGFCIVSGLARGIDTCAHKGALESGGRTIAVMGSGFNHLYPEENRGLAERIAQSGAVITEFALDERPLRQHFPQRNRIISGLSAGVLVVEAARTSGALITVDCALEQGREIFALPGEIDASTADGTNELIREGAQIVLDPADIIDVLRVIPRPKATLTKELVQTQVRAPVASGALTPDEITVRDLCAEDPCVIDELIEKSGMDISKISGILLNLQVKKIINQLPGKYYQLL